MSNYTIFSLNNIEDEEPLNIEELFKPRQEYELREYNLFKKILSRIYSKIKTTSKKKRDECYIWFVVPEIILGYPKYNFSQCISFLIDVLKKDKFLIQFYKPNTLFIYWGHYCAKYVRDEISRKTGIELDAFGEVIKKEEVVQQQQYQHPNNQNNVPIHKPKLKRNDYVDIKSFVPSKTLF